MPGLAGGQHGRLHLRPRRIHHGDHADKDGIVLKFLGHIRQLGIIPQPDSNAEHTLAFRSEAFIRRQNALAQFIVDGHDLFVHQYARRYVKHIIDCALGEKDVG